MSWRGMYALTIGDALKNGPCTIEEIFSKFYGGHPDSDMKDSIMEVLTIMIRSREVSIGYNGNSVVFSSNR